MRCVAPFYETPGWHCYCIFHLQEKVQFMVRKVMWLSLVPALLASTLSLRSGRRHRVLLSSTAAPWGRPAPVWAASRPRLRFRWSRTTTGEEKTTESLGDRYIDGYAYYESPVVGAEQNGGFGCVVIGEKACTAYWESRHRRRATLGSPGPGGFRVAVPNGRFIAIDRGEDVPHVRRYGKIQQREPSECCDVPGL